MTDNEILPEEDELMDRCLEFTSLITHKELKNERDALFGFIALTSRMRARDELERYGYTKYPILQDVADPERLDDEAHTFSGEQERFVNLVLEALHDKKAIMMAGSRFA